jgi:hypothetical protein
MQNIQIPEHLSTKHFFSITHISLSLNLNIPLLSTSLPLKLKIMPQMVMKISNAHDTWAQYFLQRFNNVTYFVQF